MNTVSTTNPGPAGTGHAPRLRRDALLAVASVAQFMVATRHQAHGAAAAGAVTAVFLYPSAHVP
jgi:hypothetical protein